MLQCTGCSVYLPLAALRQGLRSFLHLSSDPRLHE